MAITIGGYSRPDIGISKTLERTTRSISSGKKLNRASDNVSNMGISQKMEALDNQFTKEISGIQDKVGSLDVAFNGLSNISKNLISLRNLTIQAQNDTLTDSDLDIIQIQADNLMQTIDDTAKNTEFNKDKLIEGFGTTGLSIDGLSIENPASLEKLDQTLKDISNKRSEIGAEKNAKLTEAAVLRTRQSNTVEANSKISDADVAMEVVEQAVAGIRENFSLAMAAQSNTGQQSVLRLLED